MKVLLLASEMVPFAKTGGLADVAGALPSALNRQGVDVTAFLPKYRCIGGGRFSLEPTGLTLSIPVGDRSVPCSIEKTLLPETAVPVYLVCCDEFFDRDGLYQDKGKDYPDNLERFTLFSRAVLEALKKLDIQPDVIHANDWQTALIPVYLKTQLAEDSFFRATKTLFTIHNLAYQGLFPKEKFPLTGLDQELFSIHGLEFYNKVNLLKGGLLFSDRLSTVSRRYSEEIQTPEYGCGLEGVLKDRREFLSGVLNGVDYQAWSPESDSLIAKNFSAKDLSGKAACKKALQKTYGLPQVPDAPLLGVISRLADQKGFDLLDEIFEDLMALSVQFVLLGTGDPKYHKRFELLAAKYPKKCGVALKFDNALAHQIEAGADLFLMPSRYEPCGLNQMYSLRYGTIPVVRATGGLADTVEDYHPKSGRGNGFVFEKANSKAFLKALRRALKVYAHQERWQSLMGHAMRMDFSWDRSAEQYLALYQSMTTA